MAPPRIDRLLLLLQLSTAHGTFSGCSIGEYYPPSLHLYDPYQLHSLLASTHRHVLPYTSTAPDVWDALIALDADASGEFVRLIYSDTFVNASTYGETDTWNREHVWPKSRGVGYSGPDFTDVHALRPADWNVNAARNNRHFAPCGIAEVASECVRPAHAQAARDTERDSYAFLPPADRRGDVARAAFYMAVRYDGEEPDTLDLRLTDCPNGTAPDGGTMGYLSHLLRWHDDDPVDDDERARNDGACADWQGNRNPFVDFPDLAPYYFGLPRDFPATDGAGYDCAEPNPAGPSPPPAPPTSSPTLSPAASSTGPSVGAGGLCKGLAAGDVMTVSVRSDAPDTVVLAALADVPEGAEIRITDNAWTGTTFKTNEGVRKLIVPSGGIASGTIFGYGDSNLALSNSWQFESGSFSLSASADAIFVYCLDEDASGNPTVPYHLSAFSYAPGGWSDPNPDPATFDSGMSALPSALPSNAVTTLPHRDNYRYDGLRVGTRDEILEVVSAPLTWIGDDDPAFDVVSLQPSFDVRLPIASPPPTPALAGGPSGTCGGLVAGDVMIAGYNADNPDSIALVALADLPPGAEIYLTDAAWTGAAFKSNEGVKRYAVPAGGISRGTVFGYGGGFSERAWEGVSGSLLLSSSSDAIFAYCLGGSGGDRVVHLSGLSYSTSGWAPASEDESVFSTGESALPAGLPSDCSVELTHLDNYVYVGNRGGSKGQILADMSDPSHWSGSNTDRYDLAFVLGEFVVTS